MGRDNGIDYLKWIGLTGIILAHTDPPKWMMMLRSFDVPLMVLISSILARRSYGTANRWDSIWKYYLHRAKRLVLPVWIFLFIYFGVCFMLGDPYKGISYYLYSFGLTRYGVGYVWIVLIYLYGMILVPLIDAFKPSIKTIIVIGVLYGLYETAYFFGIGVESKLINSTVYYIIPYGILTCIGYYYMDVKNNKRITTGVLSLLIFIACGLYYHSICGEFQLVSVAKYPPRLYYLSYGIACSFLLLMLSEHLKKDTSEYVDLLYQWSLYVDLSLAYSDTQAVCSI